MSLEPHVLFYVPGSSPVVTFLYTVGFISLKFFSKFFPSLKARGKSFSTLFSKQFHWIIGKPTLKKIVQLVITIYFMPLGKVLWKILCFNQKQSIVFSKVCWKTDLDWGSYRRVSVTVHVLNNWRIRNHGYLNFTSPNHEDKKVIIKAGKQRAL